MDQENEYNDLAYHYDEDFEELVNAESFIEIFDECLVLIHLPQ